MPGAAEAGDLRRRVSDGSSDTFASMRAGPVADADTLHVGPLAAIRLLALEQMQALPFETRLFARLGAGVVEVEHPLTEAVGVAGGPVFSAPQGIEDATCKNAT